MIGEALLAIVLAGRLMERFGGDNMRDMLAAMHAVSEHHRETGRAVSPRVGAGLQ